MKSEWMVHKGKRLMYCNFTDFGVDADSLKVEVDAADRQICLQPRNSVLALADLRGTVASKKVVDMFKQSASDTRLHVRKQAVVGISGIKKLLAQAVARFSQQPMYLFDTVEEAKDWLVNEAGDVGSLEASRVG